MGHYSGPKLGLRDQNGQRSKSLSSSAVLKGVECLRMSKSSVIQSKMQEDAMSIRLGLGHSMTRRRTGGGAPMRARVARWDMHEEADDWYLWDVLASRDACLRGCLSVANHFEFFYSA